MMTPGPPSAVSAASSFDRLDAFGDKGRLQHQVFRRIAGDEQFGEDDKIRLLARGIGPRLARKLQVRRDVADGGV